MTSDSSFFKTSTTTIGRKSWLRLIIFLSFLFTLGLVLQSVEFSRVWTSSRSNCEPKIDDSFRSIRKPPVSKKATVGYAITLTHCSSSEGFYMDGAAVLSYSIHKNSIRHASSGSRYDYKLYAFLHADAANCTESLEMLGYEVRVLPLPVEEKEIPERLTKYIKENGCCGAKEFLKLYAYKLTDHPIIAILDTDALLLKPLDNLFDSMLEGSSSPARKRLPIMWTNKTLPDNIEAFFTRDYILTSIPGKRASEIGVQGGFLVVRPSLEVYEKFREIIREGDYFPGTGWGHSKGLKYGGFWGDPEIQGICAYFFGHIRPDTAVELDRCRINSIGEKPFAKNGECIESRCEDCRTTNMAEIVSIHFTDCKKPWECLRPLKFEGPYYNEDQRRLCKRFHDQWFRHRHEMETGWSLTNDSYNSTAERLGRKWVLEGGKEVFCDRKVYHPIQYPNRVEFSQM